jgi:predicted TIM-barrel fold metal-dependent hydrolase
MREVTDAIAALQLVDHHVHGATPHDLTRAELETLITESDRPLPEWMTQFDSQIGFAVRRWCAPLLDLPAHADPDTYVARRRELGAVEVNRRLLSASGVDTYLVETGYRGDSILDPSGMADASGCAAREVVRIESVLESLVATGIDAASIPREFPRALAEASTDAVGLKSIIAYRYGFDFDPARPSEAEVVAAATAWIDDVARTGQVRVDDPILLRFGLWSGVDRGLPIQLHTGYGDADLDLHRCDPLLLMPWLRLIEQSGVDILLLHCYPFHRQAGYLAQVFGHVYFDVGLAINYTGARSEAVIAESLELAPFSKILFSSDAWGPAELHYLGAELWRRGTASALARWVDSGEWTAADAIRVARMIARDNAIRVYRLDEDQ